MEFCSALSPAHYISSTITAVDSTIHLESSSALSSNQKSPMVFQAGQPLKFTAVQPIFLLTITLGVVFYGLVYSLWRVLRWYSFRRHSGIPEIKELGKTRPSEQKLDGTAIICGGSIAGLLTARVCADYFKEVIIVEPEEWLTGEDGMRRFCSEQEHKRTRVMQYTSLHGSQALLYAGLRELFPDLDEQCRYSGLGVFPGDRKNNFAGTPIPAPVDSYGGNLPKTIYSGRAGLETLLRRLVLGRGSYPNITQIAGTVVGVLPHSEGDASHVSGVKIRRPDLTIEELDASLVVDCTGPTRAGIKWLSQSGYGTTNANTDSSSKVALQNAKISFDQKLQYSTLTCKVTSETLAKLPIPPDQTPETVTFTLLEDGVENGRRVIALIRGDGNEISLFAGHSSDESVKYESLDSMRSLAQELKTYQKRPIPGWLYEAIDILEEAQPEIQFSHVRIPPTAYIQYHRTVNLPSNFVALGDSVLSVDPIYGQGCTKALIGAAVLNKILSNSINTPVTNNKHLPTNFSEEFFKEHFDKTDAFWQLTHLLDYGIPCTTPLPGENLEAGSLVRWYLRRVQILATKDAQAARVFWDGANGFGSAVDILHPWLVLKTLFDTATRG
ncbi:uncharacterized protein C8R40DRAFT_1104550 [Lentinula edodes]|uniref:uncharacterized protein n=1 Tax=Lentinula edodes TaxID=5353 RepID=UPI001E8D19D6|nr:uncharacterized protein C8R40DRAFT_1104550 [Lentinula edodes]KAH7875548.1 hypothetical protein C8R40DRAFT_1104550 [Lentinula edodes]